MKRFAIIGVGGYVAPRHLRAIKETGNRLIAALDKSDSVGVIDSYFPDADFFTEFERFDRHLELLRRRTGSGVDYVSVCSPNYLHDAHVRFALRIGADAVCEKPLVLNPWNVKALQQFERETQRKINTILQLRLHPAIIELKRRIAVAPPGQRFEVDLTYVAPRGSWYLVSWKGDPTKSGGVATNIGVHFFDMLWWVFGDVRSVVVHVHDDRRAAGLLELERASVRWFLSIDPADLPDAADGTYRAMVVDGESVEFSRGFTDLHTESYRAILDGRGFETHEVLASTEIVTAIRNARTVGLTGDHHPALSGR